MMKRRSIPRSVSAVNSSPVYTPSDNIICLDEFQEVIPIEKFNAAVKADESVAEANISDQTTDELRNYVAAVAAMYRNDNPFHNFEHACHVLMSVGKLLKRIVSPDLDTKTVTEGGNQRIDQILHNFTYGINSDPLAQFAIHFAALIHDVDHRGCSNVQLMKEQPHIGTKYRNTSVAEQNSLDVSWSLLMSSQFNQLRTELFGTQSELIRFRQLIVNFVLATDIFDKEWNERRRQRWDATFSPDDKKSNVSACHLVDMKATIVLEHIIQASDVAHTMQHWQIYQKWNRNLFHEMSAAYNLDRMAVDPATFWYQGELNFFDSYIIPLANKLKECNVFGVSSDEYLTYAGKL
jgi:3'5'-cyclic nucleotide phosphodiesterase